MNMEADDVVVDHPVLAPAVVAVFATVAYVGVQVVFGDAVAPLETAVFVVVFTAVYVAGNRYLRGRQRSSEEDSDTDDAVTDDPATDEDWATGK